MKKLLSMLLVLSVLLSSTAIIVTAQTTTTVNPIYTLFKSDGTINSSWYQNVTVDTVKNSKGEDVKYAKFNYVNVTSGNQGSELNFIGNVGATNKTETMLNIWIKVDKWSSSSKSIIYRTTSAQGTPAARRWELYVMGGKLKQAYATQKYCEGDDASVEAPQVCEAVDLTQYQGEFVNIVATRKIDKTAQTMTFQTYFNGTALTPVTLEVSDGYITDDNINYPDGNGNSVNTWIGGIGGCQWHSTSFGGGIAKFDIFDSILSSDDVTAKYEADKDNYSKYVSPEEKYELSNIYSIFKSDGTANLGWCANVSTDTAKNTKGEDVKYVKFVSNEVTNATAESTLVFATAGGVANKTETTMDIWVKVDKLTSSNKCLIFRTTSNQGDPNARRWELYVKDGKLKQAYATKDYCEGNNTPVEAPQVCEAVDLAEYKGEFVNIVATRKIDSENKTMTFQTYFNGEALDPVTLKVSDGYITDDNINYPDGSNNHPMWIGGHYGKVYHSISFEGGIAQFNVYDKIIPTAEYALKKYEETKLDFISSPELVSCVPENNGEMTGNVIKLNFDKKINSTEAKNALEVYAGETKLTLDSDYTVAVSGKTVTVTLSQLNFNSKYTVKLTPDFKATDDSYFYEGKTLTFESAQNMLSEVKAQLDAITDFSQNNKTELAKLKAKILPFEKLGADFSDVTNYTSYCNIKENLAEVEEATASYADDKLYIDLTFDYPVSSEYLNKIKYFAGRNEETKTVTAVKDSGNNIIGAKITADNMYKDSDYVQVTVKEGWLGQETRSFAVPTAVAVKNITVKDSNKNEKASLADITDGTSYIGVTAVNNAYENGVSGEFIIAVKDEKGVLKEVKFVPKDLTKGNEEYVEAKFENIPQNAKNYSVEVYFWNDASQMKPYTDKKAYAKTYGIDNVNDKTKDITIVAIGGSITEGGNITTPFINSWQADRTGKITFVNAGIGGTGSNYGSVRLQSDVLSKNPDVVIVEFILNDNDTPDCAQDVENIIRTCHEAEHEPVVIFLYVPDRRYTESNGVKYYWRETNQARYQTVLDNYGLTPLDAHTMALKTVNDGTKTWDAYVSEGDVHPNTTQGKAIADLMWNELSSNFGTYIKNVADGNKLNSRADIKNGKRVSSDMGSYDENWQEKTPEDLKTEGYGNATKMLSEKYVATKTAGAKYSFEFSGTKLVLTTILKQKGRKADYVIKDKNGVTEKQGTMSNITDVSYDFENVMFKLMDLSDGMHTIEITVSQSEDESCEFGIADILIDEK